MLQISPNFQAKTEAFRAVRPHTARGHVYITVAKARHLPTRARADLAARWLTETMSVKRTWSVAEHIFRVHAPTIKTALDRLEATTVAEPPINHVWAAAKPADKVAFVKTNLPEIWRLVDQVTAT
jgi:ABC-type lipopolysaccharide export system ATPase subunit